MDARTNPPATPGAQPAPGQPAPAQGAPAQAAPSQAAAPAQSSIAPPSGISAKSGNTRRRLFIILAAVLVIAAIIYGIDWLVVGSHHVSTDDAYVNADVADVTPLVSGPIIQAPATDTMPVKAGDVLVVIDPSDFKLALAQDEAALDQAQRQVQGYFATADAQSAITAAKGADVDHAKASLVSAQSDLAKARTDLARRQALSADGAVSGDELTTAQNRLQQTEAAVTSAQAAVAEAEANRQSAAGQAKAASALVSGAGVANNPAVALAQAKVDQAKLDLERTVIRAPIDGVIAKNTVEIGQRVAAGSPLMTVVPIQSVYVDANFKEEQVRKMKLGQPVTLTSDLYGGGVKFHGKVVGVAGGTGSAFAVIPAQNATGNWIKVVQRLPVRIAINADDLKNHPLRVGLSMNVDVNIAN